MFFWTSTLRNLCRCHDVTMSCCVSVRSSKQNPILSASRSRTWRKCDVVVPTSIILFLRLFVFPHRFRTCFYYLLFSIESLFALTCFCFFVSLFSDVSFDLSFTSFTFETKRFSLRTSLPKKLPTKSELPEIASEKTCHVLSFLFPQFCCRSHQKNQQTPKPEARLGQQLPLDYRGIALQVPGRHQRSVGIKTCYTQHGQLKH